MPDLGGVVPWAQVWWGPIFDEAKIKLSLFQQKGSKISPRLATWMLLKEGF